jgi:hypothetical protein
MNSKKPFGATKFHRNIRMGLHSSQEKAPGRKVKKTLPLFLALFEEP